MFVATKKEITCTFTQYLSLQHVLLSACKEKGKKLELQISRKGWKETEIYQNISYGGKVYK